MQKQTKGYEDPFYDSFEVKLGRATADLDNKAALWISETDLGEGCLFFFVGFFNMMTGSGYLLLLGRWGFVLCFSVCFVLLLCRNFFPQI